MLAYRYRHRITLQSKQEGQDPVSGAPTHTWQTVTLGDGTVLDAVPANVLTGPGRENTAANAPQAQVDARINIRWFPVSDTELANWRALWDGRIFDIQGVTTDETARREWRLTATHGVNDG